MNGAVETQLTRTRVAQPPAECAQLRFDGVEAGSKRQRQAIDLLKGKSDVRLSPLAPDCVRNSDMCPADASLVGEPPQFYSDC